MLFLGSLLFLKSVRKKRLKSVRLFSQFCTPRTFFVIKFKMNQNSVFHSVCSLYIQQYFSQFGHTRPEIKKQCPLIVFLPLFYQSSIQQAPFCPSPRAVIIREIIPTTTWLKPQYFIPQYYITEGYYDSFILNWYGKKVLQ